MQGPGSNDTHTYDDKEAGTPPGSQPWAGLPAATNDLPQQQPPVPPRNLCEGPAVNGDPYPVDESGDPKAVPFQAGDIPNIQTRTTPAAPTRARPC